MDLSKVTSTRDSNQITRAYMDSILIEPRYLDSCVPDLHMDLYGHTFESPVMIAAFSHLGSNHPGGMPEMARGAKLAGICNWAGMGPESEFEAIMAQGAPTIKIVKPYADRKQVFDRLTHAAAHGALAVGMDIDHSFNGRGYPDFVVGETMAPVSTAELRSFVQATDKPFIVKGCLSVHDAVKCAEAGVKGILLSHHHGIATYAVPPLMALPRIKAAIGNSMDIFVDCSIDSGADVFKCLAMGAKAVCVGRACLASFRENGAEGVQKYVESMNDELRALMARTASPSLDRIAKDVLWDSATGKQL